MSKVEMLRLRREMSQAASAVYAARLAVWETGMDCALTLPWGEAEADTLCDLVQAICSAQAAERKFDEVNKRVQATLAAARRRRARK